MAFTDNCDLFGSVHEDGVNRVITHIMRQRPSLFNYATLDIASNRELWCAPIEFTPDVPKYGDPLFTIMKPLPVFGSYPPIAVGFIVQITKAMVDFHPGKIISLPPELSPPLKEQHFALGLTACGAIACPSQREIDQIPIPPKRQKEGRQELPPVVLRGRTECFCIDVIAIGHVERQVIGGEASLVGKVDGIEIVDIRPEGLENNLECYLKTTLNVLLRQKLAIAIETLMLSKKLFNVATVTLSPAPSPPLPNNPAVEEDQVKAFIKMTV